jgi:hypothetical protein
MVTIALKFIELPHGKLFLTGPSGELANAKHRNGFAMIACLPKDLRSRP